MEEYDDGSDDMWARGAFRQRLLGGRVRKWISRTKRGGRGMQKSLFYEEASGASERASERARGSAENEGSLFKSAGAHATHERAHEGTNERERTALLEEEK